MTATRTKSQEASAFLTREKLRLDRMIRYSFFDVLSIAFNKPNLCGGGAVWKSALHTVVFALAIVFLVFLTQTQEAFGCYGHIYGAEYSLHVLSVGMCTLDDAPNIGSRHYTGYPISTRVYALLTVGCILLVAVVAFYIYTCVKIIHREHVIFCSAYVPIYIRLCVVCVLFGCWCLVVVLCCFLFYRFRFYY